METTQFAETGHTSFSGDYLYERIVRGNQFLRQLEQIVDWDSLSHR